MQPTLLLGCCAAVLRAQGNYDVQVYGSGLVAPKVTMVELHSNFTASIQPDDGWMYVGSHIRPRFSVPERYHLPVGLSISNEIGWQRPNFSLDAWTWEMRPIVGKKIDKWYLCFNPTLDRSLHGPEAKRGFELCPTRRSATT